MKRSPFEPELVEVITAGGQPSCVTFKKRRQKVQEISNLWRIDDGWWQKPVARLYYALELEGGSRITVFHDLIGGKWYRQNWTA
jgi:hypothetical protein